MSLRVDLILPSEQRSATPLSVKSLLRILYVSAPIVLAVLAAVVVFNMIRLRNHESILQARWDELEPRKEKAKALREELVKNQEVLDEMQAWRNARLPWHSQFLALMNEVPANIQFRTLKISQALPLIENKTPARAFTLRVTGKALGDSAEASVQYLKRRLEEGPPFSEMSDSVRVPQFGADTSEGARRTDRVFLIEMIYDPQVFE